MPWFSGLQKNKKKAALIIERLNKIAEFDLEERLSRAEPLLKKEGIEKVKKAHVAVFGLGGVGSWCAEALVRSGVGEISLIDQDRVEESNINRQLRRL